MTRFRLGFLTLAAAVGVSAALSGIQLDPTFGYRGVVTGGPDDAIVVALALQADGKIVALAQSYGDYGIALIRYTSSGSLDPSFGAGGVSTSFGSPQAQGSLAIQPDGRIVVVGTYASTPLTMFVVRYVHDGSLDPSFGNGGSVTTSLHPGGDSARSVVLQPDGRIVAAGTGFIENGVFELVRYNTDGSLDPSFGNSGSVAVDMGGPAVGVGLRQDGRFIVGGWADFSSVQSSIGLVGLLANGDLDPAFGTGGQVRTPVDGGVSCSGIALARDGTIVATGNVYASPFPVAVVRYRVDGSLDPSFASGGIFTSNSFSTTPTAIAVDARNRVLITGKLGGSFGLLRLLASGEPDPAVGPQGWTTALGGSPPNFQADPEAILVQADGKVVLGGSDTFEFVTEVALVRYVDATLPVPALSMPAALLLAIVLGLAGLLAIQRAA